MKPTIHIVGMHIALIGLGGLKPMSKSKRRIHVFPFCFVSFVFIALIISCSSGGRESFHSAQSSELVGNPGPGGGSEGGGEFEIPEEGDLCTKPGPHNTGPLTPSDLTPMGGTTVTVDGTVLEGIHFSGTVTIKAKDVIIRNFKITTSGAYGVSVDFGGDYSVTLEDGEISGMSSSGILGNNVTARRLNIHHSGGDGLKVRSNVVVECSWIHHLGMNPGAHADGEQMRVGSNAIFQNNHCDMPINESGNGPGAPFKSNACFILQEALGSIDNVLILGNWLNGGNYTLYLDGTNVQVINNRFGRDYRYGILNNNATSPIFSGNIWEGTGEPAI